MSLKGLPLSAQVTSREENRPSQEESQVLHFVKRELRWNGEPFREGLDTFLFYARRKQALVSTDTCLLHSQVDREATTPVFAERNSQQRSAVLFLCHRLNSQEDHLGDRSLG